MGRIGSTGQRVVTGGVTVAALLACAASASAGPADCAGGVVATGRLVSVAALGGTGRPVATLADTARSGPRAVVLAGILIPGNGRAKALSTAAPGFVSAPVSIRAADVRTDRRGRVVGAVETDDGRYLQADILARGLAVSDGEPGPCAAVLAAAEQTARSAGRGLWSKDGGLPRSADRPVDGLPDFIVMSGMVRSVGKTGRTTYLNFGVRFADDATVRIGPRVAADLEAAGIAVASLAGRQVTVRGWAEARNGVDIALASATALIVDDVDGSRSR